MNTALSTVRGRHDHPPIQIHDQQPHLVRRVTLIDRIALHAGIALIKWGRRPLIAPSRERRANRIEQQLARLERERAAERSLRLSVPLR